MCLKKSSTYHNYPIMGKFHQSKKNKATILTLLFLKISFLLSSYRATTKLLRFSLGIVTGFLSALPCVNFMYEHLKNCFFSSKSFMSSLSYHNFSSKGLDGTFCQILLIILIIHS